jgi:hypothetical protein
LAGLSAFNLFKVKAGHILLIFKRVLNTYLVDNFLYKY